MCICYLEGVWGCLVEPGTLCPLIAGVILGGYNLFEGFSSNEKVAAVAFSDYCTLNSAVLMSKLTNSKIRSAAEQGQRNAK